MREIEQNLKTLILLTQILSQKKSKSDSSKKRKIDEISSADNSKNLFSTIIDAEETEL